jgi:serine/threonine protein kinase
MNPTTISCPSCGHQNPPASKFCAACGGKIEQKTDPLIGRTINNRFRVDKRISSGTLSIDYLATHLKSGKQVVLKIFKQKVLANTSLAATLKENGTHLKALSHAHIARIYDIGPVGNSFYVARQYISGITLKDLIEKKGTLSHKAACTIAAQLASGLEAAHTTGIVHGSLKPSNIIIDNKGRVFLTELGLAGIEAEADIPGRTAEYLSPEQALGETYDGRADIYSLGIILYELLTGHSPFRSNSWETTVSYIIHRKPTPIEQVRPNLSGPVASLIRRSTARDRLQRYRSMGDFAAALSEAAKTQTRKTGPGNAAISGVAAVTPPATMPAGPSAAPPSTTTTSSFSMPSPGEALSTTSSTVITSPDSGSYGSSPPSSILKLPSWLILSITMSIMLLIGYGSVKMCGGPATPLTTTGYFVEEGTLSGTGDTYDFTINAGPYQYVEVYFTWPRGLADVWVKVVGEDGFTVLGDFDLDEGEIIQLMGGGVFYLTVYSKEGAATWSAEYVISDESYIDPFSTFDSPSGGIGGFGDITPADPGGYGENGFLMDTGDSYRFTLEAGYDTYVEVFFTYPRGSADFWVKVEGEDGYTVLGDFDLDEGEIIQLMGGSTFYLTIYSKDGGGSWSAEYVIDNEGWDSSPY